MPAKQTVDAPPEGVELSARAQKLLANLDKPSKRLKPEAWLDTIAVYPEGGLCFCYIYRRWPQIDLKLMDPKAATYIEKHEGPITAEELLRSWESGQYS